MSSRYFDNESFNFRKCKGWFNNISRFHVTITLSENLNGLFMNRGRWILEMKGKTAAIRIDLSARWQWTAVNTSTSLMSNNRLATAIEFPADSELLLMLKREYLSALYRSPEQELRLCIFRLSYLWKYSCSCTTYVINKFSGIISLS